MALRARVRNGRLLLDEPTDLPEGAEVELVPADWDALDEDDRRRLHAAIDASDDDLANRRMRPAEELFADLEHSPR